MIVVVGQPLYRESEAGAAVDGPAARIALAAAARGRVVQLVGKAGEDPAGDAVVLALAQGGVGHVALLREAGLPTPWVAGSGRISEPDTPTANLEAADVDLALRYLTEFAVLVLADSGASDIVGVVAAAAGWAEAKLIVVVGPGDHLPEGLPPDAIAFEAPATDPDGVFAAMVGSFAAALDDGGDPAAAFRASVDASGWTLTQGE